jgi:hypothetical protein
MFELMVGNDAARRHVQARIDDVERADEPRARRVRAAFARASSATMGRKRASSRDGGCSTLTPRESRG